MTEKNIHIPIMLDEVITHLDIQKNDCIIEGTAGFGGHTNEILKQLDKTGLYIGIDQDQTAINHSKEKFNSYPFANHYHDNFSNFETYLKKHNQTTFTKFFLDLGISSYQIDEAYRGFSHRFDGPLDMRMNTNSPINAKTILNTYSEESLSNIFYYYGELRHNKKLVENIIHNRKKSPLETTTDLRNIIKKSYFFHNKRSLFMKTCSQVFQAIRIEVNQEFKHIEETLPKLESYASNEATIVILTFHSCEDRLIKQFIKQSKTLEFNPKSVIKPSKIERTNNSRSRSAKCRIIKKKVTKKLP
ncbi:MAG: 16S rRNA (cytosine(1402)-N(4))-methyltransferase [Rickettsiales bacterium]|nr:16S rRNA (cytosine(1402)-N(4))-methyltransferase [Rickettsiales bacterium]|tara:strand:- start:454 stop:1359 length:906 start_codon:yes stop_codon:yes gene_type:complete